MENLKNRLIVADKQAKVIVICIVIFHLILVALVASAQSFPNENLRPYNFLTQSTPATRVKEIYTSQIGVREKGINAGPEVEKYLRYVGLGKGNPWCAAFVCWTLGEAGVGNPRSGWSPDLFAVKRVIWRSDASPVSGIKYQESRFVGDNVIGYRPSQTSDFRPQTSDTRRRASPPRPITDYRLLITSSTPIKPSMPNQLRPEMGDVFGLYFPEKARIAHVGFIDSWQDPWVTTVEGNTNILGSREGDGVYRKRRLVRSIYKVARYVN